MKLIMTGLDHHRADLAVREKFATTKEKTQQILGFINSEPEVNGCVLISTCNRTELYLSVLDTAEVVPSQLLCTSLCLSHVAYQSYFTTRHGTQAMDHLCRLASGLDSLIRGDDQIITQARMALDLSREQHCTDSYLETMFRVSVHAAKLIKANVILRGQGVDSVPSQTLERLRTAGPLRGRRAVVIGNGQIGRLVTELLIREGVAVTVPLREHKMGEIKVPEHAKTTAYKQRYEAIAEADMLISATASPHYMVHYDAMSQLAALPGIIIDLAVPRDIEPSVQGLPGVTLVTIDDLTGNSGALPTESLVQIEAIVADAINRFGHWAAFKHQLSMAPAGGSLLALPVRARRRKSLNATPRRRKRSAGEACCCAAKLGVSHGGGTQAGQAEVHQTVREPVRQLAHGQLREAAHGQRLHIAGGRL